MKRLLAILSLTGFIVALAAPSAFAQDGAALYKKKCKTCHGADGTRTKAGEKKGAPEKLGAAAKSKSIDHIKKTIANGVVKDGKKKMPGYAKKWSDAEIEAVAKFVKTLK